MRQQRKLPFAKHFYAILNLQAATPHNVKRSNSERNLVFVPASKRDCAGGPEEQCI